MRIFSRPEGRVRLRPTPKGAAFACLLLALFSLRGPLLSAPPAPQTQTPGLLEIPFLKVYDPTREAGELWKGEDGGTEARLWMFEGATTLECSKSARSWAAFYRPMAVDLDRYPLLEINVLGVTKQWYLILSGPQFPQGYLRLVETNRTGPFQFDIPKLTKLSGPQKIEVKIGVSDPTGTPIANERFSFDKFVFLGRPAAGAAAGAALGGAVKPRPQDGRGLYVLDPTGADIDLWQEAVKDGPQETRFSERGALAVVKGEMAHRNWGAAHRSFSVNLAEFPILEINVVSCSKQWYLIVQDANAPEKYTKLAGSNQTGHFEFDIPKLTNFSGEQTFDIQVGVSHPEGDSIKGEWAAFDLLRFKKP